MFRSQYIVYLYIAHANRDDYKFHCALCCTGKNRYSRSAINCKRLFVANVQYPIILNRPGQTVQRCESIAIKYEYFITVKAFSKCKWFSMSNFMCVRESQANKQTKVVCVPHCLKGNTKKHIIQYDDKLSCLLCLQHVYYSLFFCSLPRKVIFSLFAISYFNEMSFEGKQNSSFFYGIFIYLRRFWFNKFK